MTAWSVLWPTVLCVAMSGKVVVAGSRHALIGVDGSLVLRDSEIL